MYHARQFLVKPGPLSHGPGYDFSSFNGKRHGSNDPSRNDWDCDVILEVITLASSEEARAAVLAVENGANRVLKLYVRPLLTYSAAPLRNASSTYPGSVWVVTKMIRVDGQSSAIRFAASKPFMTGMERSTEIAAKPEVDIDIDVQSLRGHHTS
jgi:hypothetical protein